MRRLLAVAILALSLPMAAPAYASDAPRQTSIIIDTDFGQWWDDVAALAAVHSAADQGRARILGVVSDVSNEWNAPALDALNTWYGRPNIPVGVTAGAAPVPQNYSQLIAQRFPHSGRPEDGVALYRRLLRSQPDHSVTVLSIGALTTLAQLVRTDRELVARKVAQTVIMGGEYPRASVPEWNFGLDLPATRFVVANWPTPVVYDGFEIGGRVFVGNHVCASHPVRSPVRAAFDLLYGCPNNQSRRDLGPDRPLLRHLRHRRGLPSDRTGRPQRRHARRPQRLGARRQRGPVPAAHRRCPAHPCA